ncbi:MAG TPA: V-type ATP synthase subunit F [Atribacterota bacterium]|nr:V-type ATP synthase subunit F [Atribacterota bacterium]
MSNIAIIGEKDIIIGFNLVGFQPFPVTNYSEALVALEKCIIGDYEVIFIAESIAVLISEQIEIYQRTSPVSICILPDHAKDSELSMKILRKYVEKAVGTDILFRKEG